MSIGKMIWPYQRIHVTFPNLTFIEMIDKYGQHTFEMHFKNASQLSEAIP